MAGWQGQSTAKPHGPADGLTADMSIFDPRPKGRMTGGWSHHPKDPCLQLCGEGEC